ncbi:DUF4878 domain-containing protein [Bacillus sp. T33-2]|uniref:DUF4878 domain-containing protein n=1 Tax=Bacillus sp. T33-2 TaxID=2054168 RepID=UPI000C78C402|nr:DUF4878 domain-containing protein [Bacillus sp. T33-2]PLR95049.1 hypothetical protein CVD19_15410 [Bacillus sp. T33-2]
MSKLFDRFIKAILSLASILVFNLISNQSSVDAAAKDDALAGVVKFLDAEKKCDVDGMLNHSLYFHNISNLDELYSRFCKEHTLQRAKITDITIINDTSAMVSIEATYKDRITIGTAPVVKKDGKWKILKGIPTSGHVETAAKMNRDQNQAAVEQAIKNYANGIKAHDIVQMKKYIKTLPDTDTEKLDMHLKAVSEGPVPEVTVFGINMISDTLAIAQIETKYPYVSFTEHRAVCIETGQWKIVFDRMLTNSVIPANSNPIEVN